MSENAKKITLFFLNSLLFSIILILCYPTYHDADDNYFLYEISGANGNGATNNLHYDYGWHPYLTYFIKLLFQRLPQINWYSIFLYSFHFLAWSVVCRVFLKRFTLLNTSIAIIFLFAVFEAPFLLRITYTNTSILLSVASMIYLIDCFFYSNKITFKQSCVVLILAALASLLRIHAMLPFIIFASVILLIPDKHKIFQLAKLVAIFAVIIFLVIYSHRNHYITNIPGWQAEERYRQAVLSFDNLNKQADTARLTIKQRLQNKWLENGVLIDKEFLDIQSIKYLLSLKKKARHWTEFRTELYWLLNNNKICILCNLGLFLFCISRQNSSNKKRFLKFYIAQWLLLIALHVYLLLFLRIPFYLLPASLFFTSICCFIFAGKNIDIRLPLMTFRNIGFLFFTTFIVLWSTILLIKLNKKNIQGKEEFLKAWRDVHENRDKLYIAPYFSIPFNDIGVFESPYKYPITNVIMKNTFLNNTHIPIYRRRISKEIT